MFSDHPLRGISPDSWGLDNMNRICNSFCVGLIVFAVLEIPAAGQSLFWSEFFGDVIQNGSFDTSEVETIVVRELSRVGAVAMDSANGKLYWANGQHAIKRSNRDGAAVETLVTISSPPGGLAVDSPHNLLFWTESNSGADTGGGVYRTSLDGVGTERIIAAPIYGWFGDIVVDSTNGRIYWIDWFSGFIQSAAQDGSDVLNLIEIDPLISTFGLAIDVTAGVLYWIEQSFPELQSRIMRASLDGFDIEPVKVFQWGEPWPTSLLVHASSQRICWTAREVVRCSFLDGLNEDEIARLDGDELQSIALDAEAGSIYWLNTGINLEGPEKIQRTSIESGDVVDVLATRVEDALSIVLNRVAGEIYWTNQEEYSQGSQRRSIQKANRDGSLVGELPLETRSPGSMAFDANTDDLYWHDQNDGIIRRAKVDAGEIEDLVDTACGRVTLALDSGARKLYWADACSSAIYGSDLSFGQVEEVVSGFTSLWRAGNLALDLTDGRIYWSNDHAIFRANLDGSEIQEFLTQASCEVPAALSIDRAARKIYWTVLGNTQLDCVHIRRANLDGANIEDVFSDEVIYPGFVAVDPCSSTGLSGLAAHHNYALCLSDPSEFAVSECTCSDWSGDERVDLADFSIIQRKIAP